MNYSNQNRPRDPLFGRRKKKAAMMNDPSQDAEDHWYGEGHPPVQPNQDGGYGPETEDWVLHGYHMESAPCDSAAPSGDETPAGYTPPEQLPEPAEGDGADGFSDEPWQDILPDTHDEQASRTEQHRNIPLPPEPEAQDAPPVEKEPEGKPQLPVSGPVPTVRRGIGKRMMLLLAGILVICGAAFWFCMTTVFCVNTIEVEGNEHFSDEQIISMSGLTRGMSMLFVNEEKIKENIEKASHYLYVLRVEKGDHLVTIKILERTPVAYTIYHGIYYTLDSRGMVLEEYAQDTLLKQLILVDKLDIRSCIVQKHIVLEDSATLDVYRSLMVEIKAMSLSGEIASLNLDDPEDLSLYTRDGYFVRLGDNSSLHGKLKAMTLVLTELRGNPKIYTSGGTIDVSTREYPTYSPPDVT